MQLLLAESNPGSPMSISSPQELTLSSLESNVKTHPFLQNYKGLEICLMTFLRKPSFTIKSLRNALLRNDEIREAPHCFLK